MTDNVKKVMAGYLALTAAEQSEFIDELNEFNKEPPEKKRMIKKGLYESLGRNAERVLMGPVSTGCPCCGK